MRSELDYPENLGTYNEYLDNLAQRKALTSGFVKYRFQCNSWESTNGLSLPKISKLEVFLNDHRTNQPYRIVTLQAESFVIRQGVEAVSPSVTASRAVVDYRFKKKRGDRIFKYAEYNLQSGDQWRADGDPKLIKQANEWLQHGRKYKSYVDLTRNWVAWALAISCGSLVVIIFHYGRKYGNKNNEHDKIHK